MVIEAIAKHLLKDGTYFVLWRLDSNTDTSLSYLYQKIDNNFCFNISTGTINNIWVIESNQRLVTIDIEDLGDVKYIQQGKHYSIILSSLPVKIWMS